MADIESVRQLLAEEYGIRSSLELQRALKSMSKLDIGVCASPVRRGKEEQKMESLYSA